MRKGKIQNQICIEINRYTILKDSIKNKWQLGR